MNPKSTLQALGHPQSATVTQSFRRAARWNRRRSNEPGTLAGNVEGFYHLFPWLSPKHDFFEAGRLYPSLIARDRGSYLFLSNFGIASDPYIYRALDIKFVVNCSRDLPFVDEVASLLQSKPTGSTGNESQAPIRTDLHVELTDRFRVPVDDFVDHRICEHFADSVRFIAEAMEKQAGHVLIHCKHGQSRSATIAAAYLLYDSQQKGTPKTVQEVLADLKHCRPRVSPNEGFLKQLQEAFEQCWVDLPWCQWCPNLAEERSNGRRPSGMMIPWPMAPATRKEGSRIPAMVLGKFTLYFKPLAAVECGFTFMYSFFGWHQLPRFQKICSRPAKSAKIMT